jgi:hypothetical protein
VTSHFAKRWNPFGKSRIKASTDILCQFEWNVLWLCGLPLPTPLELVSGCCGMVQHVLAALVAFASFLVHDFHTFIENVFPFLVVSSCFAGVLREGRLQRRHYMCTTVVLALSAHCSFFHCRAKKVNDCKATLFVRSLYFRDPFRRFTLVWPFLVLENSWPS